MTQLGSPATESGHGPDRGSGPPAVRRSRLARRRRVLLGVGIAAALLAVGGLIGASFVKSPQQLAADTAAPPATVTTAAVVSQILTSSVEMRGVVYPATEYDVYPSAPPAAGSAADGGAAGPSGESSAPVYISKLDVAAGGTVRNGEQLAELDGQPLFARALVNRPSLLLCDEPTGNLDSRNAAALMELLDQLNAAGFTIVVITHDVQVAAHAGRAIDISDGVLSERLETGHG